MFTKKPHVETPLEKVIAKLEQKLLNPYSSDEEYAKDIKHLDVLYKIKAQERPDRMSKDQIAMIAANLAGIVLILGHERAHVVTSKAISFVMKLK